MAVGGGGGTTINPSTKHKILLLPPFPPLSFPFLSFLISVWGDFLGHNWSLRDPGLPKPTNWLHVDIFRVFFIEFGFILQIPLRRLVYFFEVLNFNRFICNYTDLSQLVCVFF